MPEGGQFCSICGCKFNQSIDSALDSKINEFNSSIKKKKIKSKITAISFVAILIITVAGILFFASAIQSRNQERAISIYLDKATDFNNYLEESGTFMGYIGNRVERNWANMVYRNDRTYRNIDEAVNAALESQSGSISRVELLDIFITRLYYELSTIPDSENEELLNIQSAVHDLHDAYIEIYDCVITPSDSYNTWSKEFETTTNRFNNKLSVLDKQIKHIKESYDESN